MIVEPFVEKLRAVVGNLDSRGYLVARESTTVEMKENYSFPNQAKYLKAMAAFANKSGGIIIFGIKDSPRIPIGIDLERFDSIKVELLSSFIGEYFSPLMDWSLGHTTIGDKCFGFLCVEEAQEKPVICKKSHKDILREGAVYYRYRGRSKLIAYPELKAIHDEIKNRERNLWMKHIEKIAKIGPRHVALIDLFQGEIETDQNKFIIQEELLSQLKSSVGFIEEGQFSEKEGAPVLRVVGEIETADSVVVANLDPDKDYPYLPKTMGEEIGIPKHDIVTHIWKLGLKGDKKYHLEAGFSQGTLHKYSKYALQKIRTAIQENQSDLDQYLKELRSEYYRSTHKK